jgi:hypothetical protein
MKLDPKGMMTVVAGLLLYSVIDWGLSGESLSTYLTTFTWFPRTVFSWVFLGGLLTFNAIVWGLLGFSYFGKLNK